MADRVIVSVPFGPDFFSGARHQGDRGFGSSLFLTVPSPNPGDFR